MKLESEIASVLQNFYKRVSSQTVPVPKSSPATEDQENVIQNVGSEETPDIKSSELMLALQQIKNQTAPGEDHVTADMLKTGPKSLESALFTLLNKCLTEGKIPDTWENSEVTILFKKRDDTNIENYRPISLLSVCVL